MVLISFTIDLWACFGPMLQAFLITTHHSPKKTRLTTHHNPKYLFPNANLMYKWASHPPCPLGILTLSDINWSQSYSPTHWTFLVTPTLLPHPVSKVNNLVSQYLKLSAHFYVQLPVSSVLPQRPLCLISIHFYF